MKSKSSKPIIILIVAAVVISAGLSLYFHRDRFMPAAKPDPASLGYVQVNTTITDVFLTGQGFRAKTRLTLQYEYKGEKYTATLELGGNSEEKYKEGDTITRWIDPAHPETLIEG